MLCREAQIYSWCFSLKIWHFLGDKLSPHTATVNFPLRKPHFRAITLQIIFTSAFEYDKQKPLSLLLSLSYIVDHNEQAKVKSNAPNFDI